MKTHWELIGCVALTVGICAVPVVWGWLIVEAFSNPCFWEAVDGLKRSTCKLN